MSDTIKVVIEIRELNDREKPDDPTRYGVFEDGKKVADCSKPSTAVNAAAVAFKSALNGVYPAGAVIAGTQNKKWQSVEKVQHEPDYAENSFDMSEVLGDNADAVVALKSATGS